MRANLIFDIVFLWFFEYRRGFEHFTNCSNVLRCNCALLGRNDLNFFFGICIGTYVHMYVEHFDAECFLSRLIIRILILCKESRFVCVHYMYDLSADKLA